MALQGRYTVVYKDGNYRTLQFKLGNDKFAKGLTIARFKQGTRFTGFGFLQPDGTVRFWHSFSSVNSPERLARIQKAVTTIVTNPTQAQRQFAEKEGRCSFCNKKLTVPASLHNGLGPDCAGVGSWKKAHQQDAYKALKRAAAPVLAPLPENFDPVIEEEIDRMKSEGPENYYMDGETTMTEEQLRAFWRVELAARDRLFKAHRAQNSPSRRHLAYA